jgi:hypothetical protein
MVFLWYFSPDTWSNFTLFDFLIYLYALYFGKKGYIDKHKIPKFYMYKVSLILILQTPIWGKGFCKPYQCEHIQETGLGVVCINKSEWWCGAQLDDQSVGREVIVCPFHVSPQCVWTVEGWHVTCMIQDVSVAQNREIMHMALPAHPRFMPHVMGLKLRQKCKISFFVSSFWD